MCCHQPASTASFQQSRRYGYPTHQRPARLGVPHPLISAAATSGRGRKAKASRSANAGASRRALLSSTRPPPADSRASLDRGGSEPHPRRAGGLWPRRASERRWLGLSATRSHSAPVSCGQLITGRQGILGALSPRERSGHHEGLTLSSAQARRASRGVRARSPGQSLYLFPAPEALRCLPICQKSASAQRGGTMSAMSSATRVALSG